jgi:hypothetical protein
MTLTPATIEDVLSTFSSHLAEHYPEPAEFRRNFDLLLGKKRERPGAADYPATLERNLVFLNDLVAEAETLVARIASPDAGGLKEEDVAGALEAIEKRSHESNSSRHREAFVDGTAADFAELRADRGDGGKPYLEKLEFNYRYLMTYRIFLFEFIAVLAAIRVNYSISGDSDLILKKIRNHLELTAHFYLGNVAVRDAGDAAPGGKV